MTSMRRYESLGAFTAVCMVIAVVVGLDCCEQEPGQIM
jgi:hypothetical protein